MGDRLDVGRPARGFLAGLLPIGDGLDEPIGLGEMAAEQFGLRRRALGKRCSSASAIRPWARCRRLRSSEA